MFSKKDLEQIASRGSDLSVVEKQIKDFKDGFPFLKIKKAATVGDGIIQLQDEELANLVKQYEQSTVDKQILKFVPASGAATRMFKDLYAFLSNPSHSNEAVDSLMASLDQLAFYSELKSEIEKDGGNAKDPVDVVSYILKDKGLGYGSKPKALLKFHAYDGQNARTSLEEHLVEGAKYAKSGDGSVHIHFTVSAEHLSKFQFLISEVQAKYEHTYGVRYVISYSQQKKSTDTIAVDDANQPFREEDDALLFRPAGHGALLDNINDLDADIIFIKNIDNVVPDRLKGSTVDYKKALAAVLLSAQQEIFDLMNLNHFDSPNDIAKTIKDKYGIAMVAGFDGLSNDEKTKSIKDRLNRPLRVCGMVKNTGEPGGGPFWVEEKEGSLSLQIAETAQIDLNNPEQAAILKNSSHFNPVDLVCATKDYEGNQFDLMQYRDNSTGFVSVKSKNGKALKAMELPGLWNGAMADWITLFVEVPVITFNPVKTANDLLKDTHQ